MKSILCLLSLCLGSTLVSAAQLTPDEKRVIDAAVRAEMERQAAVGVSIGIIRDGEVMYTAGYGLADRNDGTPVTAETMYRWASISKPLTAVAAMQLAQADKLDLEANIRTLVPEFPDKGSTITTRQLLGHVGGIVHYRNGPVVKTETSYNEPHPYADVVKAIDTFKASPLVSKPGEAFNYSTHGYILASAVVQRAGAMPFAAQVKARIAEPLGMTTLQPDYQWVDIPNRAKGYRKLAGIIMASPDVDVSWKLGGGGWISTVDDLARFAAGLMGNTLLQKDARDQLWTPQRTSDGTHAGYGLGFAVSGSGDALSVSHSGSQAKTRTLMSIQPAMRSGVVVMTNSEWVDRGRIMAAVVGALPAVREPATVP